MRTLTVFVFLVIIIPLRGFSQQAQNRLNLNQCIDIALKNNIDMQRGLINSENVRISWQQARANLLPSFDFGVSYGISKGRSIDPITNDYIHDQYASGSSYLGGSLLLFNGMQMRNSIRQSSLALQAAKQDEQLATDNLILQITGTYMEVLANQDLLNLAKSRQETTAKQLERLEVLNKSGTISPDYYYDLKGQYASDRLSITDAVNSLENSKISLVELLNIPYNKNLQLDPLAADESLVYDASPEQIYQSALQNLAEVKAADFRKKSADIQLRSAKYGSLPSISVSTGISSSFSNSARDIQNRLIPYPKQFNNNLSQSFGIGLSLPLFNSFRVKNQILSARLNQRESELLALNTRTRLQQRIEQAYFNMTASRERYLSLKEQIEAYAESFRTVEIRFNAGMINSVDYMIAKNNLDRANISLFATRYDFILRKKTLDFYQGKALY